MYNPKYIANQEKIKTRAIYRIFKRQLESFASLLERETKSTTDTVVADFMDENWDEIPLYISEQIPKLANQGMNDVKKDWKKELGAWYGLSFDIDSSPASNFIRNKEKLNLSQKDGSISKTTQDELKRIIADWIDEWMWYWAIAKQIREVEPFVFSKSRAELIAVQEVWQAYWFGNYQPFVDMQQDWYIFEKKWLTSHDAKVRETHTQNEEEGWVPLDHEYSATWWDSYAPSQDFRCRCYMTQRIAWVKEIHLNNTGKMKIVLRRK